MLLALLAGAGSYTLTRTSYDSIPGPGVTGLFWIGILVIAEFYLAVMTRARLAGRSGTKPINPLVVVRFVALAKASSVVGAIFAGGYGGFLAWVAHLDSPSGNHDTKVTAIGVALSVAWIATALFLEYVCRVPKGGDDDPHADTMGD